MLCIPSFFSLVHVFRCSLCKLWGAIGYINLHLSWVGITIKTMVTHVLSPSLTSQTQISRQNQLRMLVPKTPNFCWTIGVRPCVILWPNWGEQCNTSKTTVASTDDTNNYKVKIVDESVMKKFDKNNKTLRWYLLNHMTNFLFDLFVTFKSAKVMWEKLKIKYGVCLYLILLLRS